MNNQGASNSKLAANNRTWNSYYRTYQKDSVVPGIKYPNEHLVRFMNVISRGKAGGRILELGFGNITNMVMMQSFGFRVLGLEVSEEAVARARQAIEISSLHESLAVDVFVGQILPVEDQSFDAIVGLQCVYYNTDQELFAKECARALKSEGKIFFSFFSPRSSYMQYIDGCPGGLVKFTENHPNPRLRGLELFLFKSRVQFQEIYGKYFDLEVGLEESDLYPHFMSWYYLVGSKKDSEKPLRNFICVRPTENFLSDKKESSFSKDDIAKTNFSLWEKKYAAAFKEDLIPGNKYPNEHFVRFIATQERSTKLQNYFNNIGKEDLVKPKGKRFLEIMPNNITNLVMSEEMRCIPSGLSFSKNVIDKSKEALRIFFPQTKIGLDLMRDGTFPYQDNAFDLVISEKIGTYIGDQEKLVREVSRVTKPGGAILIGYLSPAHSYMQWTEPLGAGYYRITQKHPDNTLHGMIIFVEEKGCLLAQWNKYFETEVKFVKQDIHRYFSSVYFIKGKRNSLECAG